jgi:hypothetical protein
MAVMGLSIGVFGMMLFFSIKIMADIIIKVWILKFG